MSSTLPSVINMVNTAFGVTVLAVPYCFHQCGIILGCILLAIASYASRRSCYMLLRSAQVSRKSDFESLGFHVDGFIGKSIVEMSLIGYLGGTCIAWFVVIGDVAPAVISSVFGIEKSWNLRMVLIILIGVFAVLPLSLIKDIKSLSSASSIAIGIYTVFVVQLLFSTLPKILSGDWISVVNFWKPDGMLQCIPIFVISFLCQTVLFVIYDSLHEPTVIKMEKAVSTAMDTLLFLSTTVGFCGYVMFCEVGIQGDLLNNYEHDFISEFIRLGFCVSTVLSFPLLIFPCRDSINSMISSAKSPVENTSPRGSYIPDDTFSQITFCLVVGSLTFGIIFPSVEFVMALVGATMGASLTYILPSYIFLKVAGNDTSKTEAKVLLTVGICLFCLSTFTVLSMSESQETVVPISPGETIQDIAMRTQIGSNISTLELDNLEIDVGKKFRKKASKYKFVNKKDQDVLNDVQDSVRKEPVLPQERSLMDNSIAREKLVVAPLERPAKAVRDTREIHKDDPVDNGLVTEGLPRGQEDALVKNGSPENDQKDIEAINNILKEDVGGLQKDEKDGLVPKEVSRSAKSMVTQDVSSSRKEPALPQEKLLSSTVVNATLPKGSNIGTNNEKGVPAIEARDAQEVGDRETPHLLQKRSPENDIVERVNDNSQVIQTATKATSPVDGNSSSNIRLNIPSRKKSSFAHDRQLLSASTVQRKESGGGAQLDASYPGISKEAGQQTVGNKERVLNEQQNGVVNKPVSENQVTDEGGQFTSSQK